MTENALITEKKTRMIPTSIYFTDEDNYDDFISDFPGVYENEDQEGPIFEDVIHEVTMQYLHKAFDRMEDLFECDPIHNISIGIDLMGLAGIEAIQTGGINKDGKNNIMIGLMPNMIRAFLNKYWHQNSFLDSFYELNFDHELVHGLDTIALPLNLSFVTQKLPMEYFIKYLMKYRMEGLACLVTFLRGIQGEKSIVKSKELFQSKIEKLHHCALDNRDDCEKFNKKTEEDRFDPYEIGPMMMLHVIGVKAISDKDDALLNLVKKGMKIEFLTDSEINRIIAAGLKIDLYEYILGLSENGCDETPFIESEKMQLICQMVYYWELAPKDVNLSIFASSKELEELENKLDGLDRSTLSEYDYTPYELEFNIDQLKNQINYHAECKNLYLKYFKTN